MVTFFYNKNKIRYIHFVCFFILLSLLYCVKNTIINYVAYASSILICTIIIFNSFRKRMKINRLLIYILIYAFYNIFFLLFNFSSKGLYIVLQQLILIFFAYSFSNLSIDKNDFEIISKFMSKIYYFFLIFCFFIVCLGVNNIIQNNIYITIYKAFFALSYFAFVRTKNKNIFCIISAIIFFCVGERTVAIIFFIIAFIYKLIKNIKNKKQYKILVIITISILLLFVLIYVQLPKTELGITINQLSRELSGANFFSGRNVIWGQVLSSVENHELFGLGYNNQVELDYGGSLSTHNLYLWLILNGGYVLLGLFIILIVLIWNRYYNNLYEDRGIGSSVYFLAFIVLCNFELLLVTNNFVVSLVMWLVISIGNSNYNKEK